ncbi:MAG: hypothetical protein EBR82_83805, partial [Caulobacteraceae bacterium]|nr:hypothetical protein [Caulobacteraceae bacterium]
MIVSETQRLSWQRDILNQARILLVKLRGGVGHGQAIEINQIIGQIDSAMVIAWELIGKGEKKDA